MTGNERGYAMAALLVALSVMAVVLSVAMPVWNTMAQREKEAELEFRGTQYARAIERFQRRYAGAYPPTIDVLINEKFLRKRYKDPLTGEDFALVRVGGAIPGQTAPQQQGLVRQVQAPRIGQLAQAGEAVGGAQAGIQGVVSTSTAQSFRLFNGRDRYNEWAFVATATTTQAGQGGGPGGAPGQTGAGGAPPGRGGQQPGGVGQQPGRGVQLPGGGGVQQPGRGAPGRGNAPQPGFPQPQQPTRGRGF